MQPSFDLVIRGGTVIDGSGGPPQSADIAVSEGRIAGIGRISGRGREEIDARDRLVTPGFVDIHTHFDGQVTWDTSLAPSSGHGVTTVVMGNCGVGFAPCRPADRDVLIRVMEGVEDIPGIVMAEGIPWAWESFAEYLAFLERRHYDADIAAQVPHAPVRVYAMGQRGVDREPATSTDMAAMAALVRDAIAAGALGFSTSRTLLHRTKDGTLTPSVSAGEDELLAIAGVLRELGTGVLQMIDDFADPATGFAMWRRIVSAAGRPLSFNLVQHSSYPTIWRALLDRLDEARADGLPIRGQVIGRPVSLLFGLELSFHPFCMCPSYRPIADLPLAERVAVMRDPALKRRLLAEQPVSGRDARMVGNARRVENMFELGDPPDYSPPPDRRLEARAGVLGMTALALAYDLLLEGRTLFLPVANFEGGNLDNALVMMRHGSTLLGLGDGGAHCGVVCDSSISTYMLTYWARDRAGERLPLPWVVRALSRDAAAAVGLADRGLLAPGLKADINVIDHDRLRLGAPRPVWDLPAGGRRLMQTADGYAATIVSGTITRRDGVPTGARPGRLVRGSR